MYLEKLIELVPAPANPVGNDDSSIVYKNWGFIFQKIILVFAYLRGRYVWKFTRSVLTIY